MTREELVKQVSGHLHAEQHTDAARLIASFSNLKMDLEKREDVMEVCSSLFYWCLNNKHYDWAASMIWNKRLFYQEPRPHCTNLVWDNIETNNSIMLMGAASMSKSYGAGAWLLLDWVRDPEYTNVNLVGPSENHLKDNLFTHLVTLHAQSTLPLPGFVNELFIGLDSRMLKGAIRGIVIPVGRKAAGRLQGRKRVPRKEIHPYLGAMSRIRFFLDEVEKIPLGVWKDVDNVFSNLDDDVDGVKILCAFNPEDATGEVSQRCEPAGGWEAFDAEKDEVWRSKRGWTVVRLDAAKCENVISGQVIYPGLQTKTGFDRIIQNAGGMNTPGYWTMARACFPPVGAVYSVISDYLFINSRRTLLFAEEPVRVAGVDVALEGNDPAKICFGRFGKSVGYREEPSLNFPRGRTVMFKDCSGKPLFRWGLQADKIEKFPRADTVKMATAIRASCVLNKVDPKGLMVDRTGNGAGVHDLLKNMWSPEVLGVNYSEGATERKVLEEDSKTPKEELVRVVSELWFATKKWLEFNFLALSPTLGADEQLKKQVTGRRYDASRQNRVEPKDEYMARNNPSPNDADALTLMLHAVRVGFGVVPSALDHVTPETVVGYGPINYGPMPCVVDETCRQHALEDYDTEEFMT